MGLGIMRLNMRKLRRLPERWYVPIKIPQPLMNIWVPTPDIPNIRLKMLDIYCIETNDRGEETDICFCDVGPEVVGACCFRKAFLDAVKGGEEGGDGLSVGGFGGCEPGFVDTIVNVVVNPFVGFLDILLQVFGEEVDGLVFLVDDIVELKPQKSASSTILWRIDLLRYKTS